MVRFTTHKISNYIILPRTTQDISKTTQFHPSFSRFRIYLPYSKFRLRLYRFNLSFAYAFTALSQVPLTPLPSYSKFCLHHYHFNLSFAYIITALPQVLLTPLPPYPRIFLCHYPLLWFYNMWPNACAFMNHT